MVGVAAPTFVPLPGKLSFSERSWRLALAPETEHLSSIADRLLACRGVTLDSERTAYLGLSLRDMPDPALMPDISRAALRILEAIDAQERITVYGDYDVDGVTSSAVLSLALRDLFGTQVQVYIPNRLKEGYGLNKDALLKLAKQTAEAGLLITVDNGSSAVEEVDYAQSLGFDVIIVDHHQVSEPEPNALAHLNPHRKGAKYPFKGLAAVGIAFMLLVEIRRQARLRDSSPLKMTRIDQYLDIVALGTVADVAPLIGVNRAMVRYGLAQMRKSVRVGIDALCKVAGVEAPTIDESDLGYRLGPRVNAAGRLENAADGYDLLIAQDTGVAARLAERLEMQNKARREIQQAMENDARTQAEAILAAGESEILILQGEDWHPGVVGIVASRMVDTFHLPTFCLALDGNIWKGSGRSIPGVNLKQLLDLCAETLMRFGGHVAAAGLTVAPEKLEAFRALAHAGVQRIRDVETETVFALDIDLAITPNELSFEMVSMLERAGPFGHENPMPKFLIRGVRTSGRIIGKNHLRLERLVDAPNYVQGIAWQMGECLPWLDGAVDIACNARVESWRGRKRLSLNILDMRPTSEEAMV